MKLKRQLKKIDNNYIVKINHEQFSDEFMSKIFIDPYLLKKRAQLIWRNDKLKIVHYQII